ncbi:MAG: gas vesicle protein GvpG [Isosphaeraceae bacterium]
MLVVDDALLFPFKSLLLVFREIYNAAIQEQEQEAERIRNDLSQLYLSLETGAIDEATFDDRESELLDRLDALEAHNEDVGDAADDEDDALDEDDDDDGPYEYLPYSELEPTGEERSS